MPKPFASQSSRRVDLITSALTLVLVAIVFLVLVPWASDKLP